jgi:phage repressor protein C with HTH and peptisase S24 domain
MDNMNEMTHSLEYDYDGLIKRISDILGDESYLSFSKRAGMSDTAFKRYILNGAIPPIDKAWIIARAALEPEQDREKVKQLASWIAFDFGYRTESKEEQDVTPVKQSSEFDDIVMVDSEAIFKKAGCGYVKELGNRLPFSKTWLTENSLQDRHLALIRMNGDSMYSSISSRDTALVEILSDDVLQSMLPDDVYVIHINKQIQIKRIQRTRSGYLIKSDNPRYDVYTLHDDEIPDDFKVIARWTGKKF